MANIKIHVFHTGEVCVAPDLPFACHRTVRWILRKHKTALITGA